MCQVLFNTYGKFFTRLTRSNTLELRLTGGFMDKAIRELKLLVFILVLSLVIHGLLT